MLRGINRQQIFFDNEDYQYFIHLLNKYKSISGYHLFAYCLMGNHIHLLIQTDLEPLDMIFRRIGSSFVYWYNTKYERVGHLFQDRFRSEPVDTEQYFFTVLRYILRNPIKAGFCTSPERYPYSSGAEYILGADRISDKEFPLKLMDADLLRDFLLQPNEDCCLDIDANNKPKCTDSKAKSLILLEFGSISPEITRTGNRQNLNKSIQNLIHSGISIRQLSRLTGLSKKIIEEGIKKRN